MTYISYPIQSLGGGLNLRDKADAVQQDQCVDAMNVIFSDRGAIEQRDGYDNLTASALTNRPASLEPFYRTDLSRQLLAGCGTRLEAIKTDGTVIASATGLTNAVWDFARFSKPNAEVAYAGNGTDTLRKWDGSEWKTPKATVDAAGEKAMPKGGLLCLTPADNRLVVSGFSTTTGGPNGGISSPSHVYFSEVGDPESYESTAYEQFTPGDGERIQAVIAWKEFVFVFKETRFFVITGTSTDSEGKPIFNYRAVDGGAGLASPRAVVAHPSGVYFMARNGVYRTTGQEPELISSLVEPIWAGGASPFYTGGTLAHGSITNCAMGTWEDRIYLAFPTESANSRILVYDPQFEWWSLFDIPASCLATFRVGNTSELVFGYASGSNHIGRHSSTYTNDDGTAISSRWRSGWFDLENPAVKTVRETEFWGSGKVFCGLGHDFEQGTGTEDLLDMSAAGSTEWDESTWGGGEWTSSPGLVEARKRRSTRGKTFSLYFFNNTKDQEFSVHRATHQHRETRRPSAPVST